MVREDSPSTDEEATDDEQPTQFYPHKKTKWTEEESARLMQLVKKNHGTYGKTINWPQVAKQMKAGRSGKQCRERWMNSRPEIKKGDWTPQEEDELVRLHAQLGPAWTRIMSDGNLHNRTDNAIKNHFNALMRCKTVDTRPLTLLTAYVALLRIGAKPSSSTREHAELLLRTRRAAGSQKLMTLTEMAEEILKGSAIVAQSLDAGMPDQPALVQPLVQQRLGSQAQAEESGLATDFCATHTLTRAMTAPATAVAAVEAVAAPAAAVEAAAPAAAAVAALAAPPAAVATLSTGRNASSPNGTCLTINNTPSASASGTTILVPALQPVEGFGPPAVPPAPVGCAWRRQLLGALHISPVPEQGTASVAARGNGPEQPSTCEASMPEGLTTGASGGVSGVLGVAGQGPEQELEPEPLVFPGWQVTTALCSGLDSASSEPAPPPSTPTPFKRLRRQFTFGVDGSTGNRGGGVGKAQADLLSSFMPHGNHMLTRSTHAAMSAPWVQPQPGPYYPMDMDSGPGMMPRATRVSRYVIHSAPVPHTHGNQGMDELARYNPAQLTPDGPMYGQATSGEMHARLEWVGGSRPCGAGTAEAHPWQPMHIGTEQVAVGEQTGGEHWQWSVLPALSMLCNTQQPDRNHMMWQSGPELDMPLPGAWSTPGTSTHAPSRHTEPSNRNHMMWQSGPELDMPLPGAWSTPGTSTHAPSRHTEPSNRNHMMWQSGPELDMPLPGAWSTAAASTHAHSRYTEPATARSAPFEVFITGSSARTPLDGMPQHAGVASGPPGCMGSMGCMDSMIHAGPPGCMASMIHAGPPGCMDSMIHAGPPGCMDSMIQAGPPGYMGSMAHAGQAPAQWSLSSGRSSQSGYGAVALSRDYATYGPSIPVPPPAYHMGPIIKEESPLASVHESDDDLWSLLME